MHKKVVLFCPSFFGYDQSIKKEVESIGATVDLYDERPFESTIGKAILRFNLSWMVSWYIEQYFFRLLLPRVHDIDYLIFINPESVSSSVIDKLRRANPRIKIIVYMWDSFKNKPAARQLLKLVDCFFTFDPDDSTVFDIFFLPLFYVNEYSQIRAKMSQNSLRTYQLSFIGTAHTKRYKIVKGIMKDIERVFLFLYTPSKFVFLYKKYICGELGELSFSSVSSRAMLRNDVVAIVADSNAVIDVNHPDQVGLTMRTLEVLGAGRKLITTNHNIIKYDFYNENNILVYDESIDKSLVMEFLNKPYVKLDEKLYNSYSLSSWVEKLFCLER